MKPKRLLFLFCMTTLSAAGQDDSLEPIETDRPDQTESPSIVPRGWFQFELGLQRDKGPAVLYTLPTVLSKYGISKKLELRLITENTSVYTKHFTDTFGIEPVRVGFKYNLLQEHGLIPQTSVIAHMGLNRVASKFFKDNTFLAPEFRITMQHTLSQKVGLGYNLGAEWEETNKPPYFIYTLAPGLSFAENWYGYVELFGSIRRGKTPEHNFDGGIAYTITPNMRADLSAGVGITRNSFDHYIAVGFSFRFPVQSKRS